MIHTSDPPYSTAHLLLRAEVLAARLEATARAEPEMGQLWRAELVLSEAVASVGLEGVRVSEAHLLPRVAANGGQRPETEGAELALGLMRPLKTPGDPLARPVEVLRRFERIAGSTPDPEAGPLDDDAIAALFAGIRPGDMPILTAARVAAGYARLTHHASPAVERLVFMAVEGRLRGAAGGPASAEADPLRGLSGRIEAAWVCPPALALSHRRFQPWAPGSAAGLSALAEGLNSVLEAETGRIALSRDWLRRGLALAAEKRRSTRIADTVRAFASSPVLSSGLLSEAIGVSRRGALNLLEALEAEGLLRELTDRRSARIWAVPGIGDRLAARPGRGAFERMRGGRASIASLYLSNPHSADSVEKVFDDLDIALARNENLLHSKG